MVKSLVLFLSLLLFWIVLSGKMDFFHLALGVLSSAFVTFSSKGLMRLPLRTGALTFGEGKIFRFRKLLSYCLWLLGQITVSSFRIAWIVFQVRMPIQPRLVRFRTKLPHTLAKLFLANSITLTPGTITLDNEGDHFTVHSLVSEHGLFPKGKPDSGIPGKVAGLFESPFEMDEFGEENE